MSNSFYSLTNPLIAGSVAKSNDVNNQLSGIEVGFDGVEAALVRAIKLPTSETADQTIVETPGERQGFLIGFDETGALAVTNKFFIDWDMDSHRMRNMIPAVANDEPVTLGQLIAYSGSLAGLPSIVGQDGPLVTDGATLTWDSVNRLIPSTAGASPSSVVSFDGSSTMWTLPWSNKVFDPNGTQGTGYWTSSLSAVEDVTGYYWRNSGTLTAATFDHAPNASGFIPCAAAIDVTAAVTVKNLNLTAGTMGLVIRAYDSGFSFISESSAVDIPASDLTRYASTFTTPSLTAYVKAVVVFTGVTAVSDDNGIHLRNLKLEFGSSATPFNDDKTNALGTAASASNPFGFGFASPSISLGDATSTTAVFNFRSAAGAQAYDARILSAGGTNGTVGKAALSIASASLTNTGPIGYASEYDAGNSGASKTIDFANGSKQKLTLNAVTPAITIAAAPVVGQYQIKIVQDAGTPRVPSFVGIAAGNCVGNAFPVISATLGGVTFLYLYWDGAVFWVSSSQWD